MPSDSARIPNIGIDARSYYRRKREDWFIFCRWDRRRKIKSSDFLRNVSVVREKGKLATIQHAETYSDKGREYVSFIVGKSVVTISARFLLQLRVTPLNRR